ncbi:hypothetical protein J1N35_001169, partial [Gossypium stocksii]
EIDESSHSKLDWMMHWMQELCLIFQEFARQDNIKVPNYTSDMFGPTHQENEYESEEESEDEEREEDEEMHFEEDD